MWNGITFFSLIWYLTRMHSCRMCTTHSSLPQRMLGYHPPGVGPETPLGVGLETPSRPDPSTSPWVWAWRPPPGQTPQLPLWVWAWRPAIHAGIPPPLPCEQNSWHTFLKILPCPNFVAGGKNASFLFRHLQHAIHFQKMQLGTFNGIPTNMSPTNKPALM